jgi:cellobiose phosphorylase
LILLFDPPFDKGTQEPGYIKGYVPGIRENGGQYTHAATWVVLATALLGQGARAVELFGLLNPILHSDSPEKVARYKVEPYVVAADVYGAPPHTGRGGWTWYTGSAGWLYRVGLEAILGFRIRENCMHITPCIPPTWQGYEITYRYGSATYHVSVENRGRDVQELSIDGKPIFNNAIDLVDDGRLHEVLLILSMERQRKWEDAAD